MVSFRISPHPSGCNPARGRILPFRDLAWTKPELKARKGSCRIRLSRSRSQPSPLARRPCTQSSFDRRISSPQQDRLLLADAESSIAEHAGFAGLEYQQSNWNYRQIVCPSFPNHLFLQYTRNNGVGDITVFSASIPRNGEGRVRIVPILKRGYSLFSPAPINALTISAFNHIRAEEGKTANSDWLGNALCYAALAGAQPRFFRPVQSPRCTSPSPLSARQWMSRRRRTA